MSWIKFKSALAVALSGLGVSHYPRPSLLRLKKIKMEWLQLTTYNNQNRDAELTAQPAFMLLKCACIVRSSNRNLHLSTHPLHCTMN